MCIWKRSLKLHLSFLLFLLSITRPSLAQTRYLIPFRDGDLWGYADTNQNMVIKPTYDEAYRFFMGYAPVTKGKLQGVLNVRGEEVIPPVYDQVIDYYSENAVVVKNGQAGLIHMKNRNMTLPLSYRQIFQLYGRFYMTTTNDLRKGIFDAETTRWVLAKKYDDIIFDSTKNGKVYYTAKGKNGPLHFFLTEKGRFSIIKPAIQGSAAIEKKKAPEGPPQQELVDSAAMENYFLTQPYTLNGKQGFLSILARNGVKTIDSIPAIYDAISRVKGSDRLLIVRKDGKEGVITVDNKVVMPCLYEEVKAVDSALAPGIYIVKMNGRYGLAQSDKLLLSCQYDIIWGLYYIQPADFDRSIAYYPKYKNLKFIVYVTKGGKRGFTDLTGREFFKN